jgi:hypothetical protein
MRTRLASSVLRPMAPSLNRGLGIAACFIVVESVLVDLLKQIAPGNAFGVVFLIGRLGDLDSLAIGPGGDDVGGQRPRLRLLP